MRRLLVAVLLCVAALGVPGPAQAQTARPVVQLTDADAGRTVHVQPGTQVQVRLAPDSSGDVWSGVELGGPTLHLVRYAAGGSLEADLDALAARAEPQGLTATTDAACFHAEPACARPGRVWSASIVVDPGPTDTSEVACAPAPRPSPSAAPGTVFATASDDGRTVQVPRDGLLVLYLDGCAEPAWALPRADRALFRTSAGLDRRTGAVDAYFRPQAAGTATVTAGSDARCLHRTGADPCAVVQRAFSLTVQVTSGASTPSACTKPVYEAFEVRPLRVSAGDAVSAAGGRDDLCVDDEQEPEHDFTLLAQPDGGTETVVETRRALFFRSEVRPATTTTYRLLMDGREVRRLSEGTTVVVDRTSGSCGTELGLTGPARAAAGSPVHLTGRAPAGSQVSVLFRRYGETTYAVRRTVVAAADGSFSATWTASDDHRWYARTARCDSPAGLTKAAPVVTGPAVVRRGATVVLHVQAVAGVRTTVFFRGAGQPFSARRTLSGPGTVTYLAQDDQRYYALTRDTISNHGLTQVR